MPRGIHLGARPTTSTGGTAGRITFYVVDDALYLVDPVSGYTFTAPVTFVGPTNLPSGLITAETDVLFFHYAGGTWSSPATQSDGTAPVGGVIINDVYYTTIANVTYALPVTSVGDVPGMPPGGDTSLVVIDGKDYIRIVFPTGEVRYEEIHSVPTPDGTGEGGTPPSNLPYDPVLWDGNLDAATKNVLRDKFESLPMPIGVNALDYGLIPDDPDAQDLNKTAMLALMAFAAGRAQTDIYIPDGDYYINCSFTGSIINVPSGTTIRMGKHTRLIVDNAGDTERWTVFRIQNQSNILISGGEIVGSLAPLSGSNYGFGVSIGGTAKNITIKDLVIRDCHMDGLYANGEDCRFENVECYNCKRHGGCSTIGKRMEFVGCRFSSSIDYFAFDLETESATDVEDLLFDRCIFDSSVANDGVRIISGAGAGVPVRTRFTNCEFFGNAGIALHFEEAREFLVENCRFHDGTSTNIQIASSSGGRVSGCSITEGGKGIYVQNSQGIDILDNHIFSIPDDAICTIANDASHPLSNIKILGNLIHDITGIGIDFRGTSSQIVGNRINRTSSNAIILSIEGAQNTILAGNKVSEVGTASTTIDAINISGIGHLVYGNDVKKCAVSHTATAQAGAASTITLATTASPVNGTYVGYKVTVLSGTGSGQTGAITGYAGTTRVATVNPTWGTAPDATSVYEIIPAGNCQRYAIVNVSQNSTIYGNDIGLGGTAGGLLDGGTGTLGIGDIGVATGTSLTLSGTGAIISRSGSSTAANYINIATSGQLMQLGVERSTGGAIAGGAGAYSVVLNANSSGTSLHLATDGNARFTVGPTGNCTVLGSGTLTVPDDPYNAATWDGNLSVPTKNAVRDALALSGVNVKAYGAVGNGTTDDTAAFQTAIDSSTAASVYVPAGTYRINEVVLRPGTTLIGAGIGSTILKKIDGFDGDAAVGPPMLNAQTVTGLEKITIRDLSIDGNRASQTGGASDGSAFGIMLCGVTNWILENLHIKDCWTDGIYITGGVPGVTQSTEGNYGVISNVFVTDCRRNNLTIICGGKITVSNSSFVNAGSGGDGTAPKAGMCCETDNLDQTITNILVSGCNFLNNGSHGILFTSPFGTLLDANFVVDAACIFSGNALNGIWATGNGSFYLHGISIGGIFLNNAGKAIQLNNVDGAVIDSFVIDGSADGIYMLNNCNNCLIGSGSIKNTTTAVHIPTETSNNTRISDGCKIVFNPASPTTNTVINAGTATEGAIGGTLTNQMLVARADNANERLWSWQSGSALGASGTIRLRAVNDAFTDGANAMVITRSGVTIGSITFGAQVFVPDQAYGGGWLGSLSVPTKNAIYNKIESLAAGASILTGYKTTNQLTASGTAVNATGMSFAIAAGEVWSFEFYLGILNEAAGSNPKFAFDIPAACTIGACVNSTSTSASFAAITADSTLTSGVLSTTSGRVTITGMVQNGVNAGTIQLMFASGDGINDTSIVGGQSYFVARKMN